jgi:hypothetical protein
MDKTGFKLDRESFCTGVTVLDTSVEQSVEKDFVLPDYCADIFRILKCIIEPTVVSQTINGGKLSFEICVTARVLYCSESGGNVNCIVQKMNYTKSVDLADNCLDPSVCITPRCDYVNCRVVNSRRLDIRGSLSVRIRVTGSQLSELITDAEGGGIELRKNMLTYPARRLTAAKRITLIEELELSNSKPQIGAVLSSACTVIQKEHKMIAGKLITKGDAEVSLLYSCIDGQGEESVESMKFSLPFSQIIDIDGIDDTFTATVDIRASECEIIPRAEDSSTAECEIVLLVRCTAIKYDTALAVTDAFSTAYETELEKLSACEMETAAEFDDTAEAQTVLSKADEGIACVYSCTAQCSSVTSRFDNDSGKVNVSGNISFRLLGRSSDGSPLYIEKDTAFDKALSADGADEDCALDICAEVTSCSYRLTSDDTADAQAIIGLKGKALRSGSGEAVTEIKLLTDKPKERRDSCCVKLCRCGADDDIWDIAKRYSTSVSAILESNDLTETSAVSEMLLIPIV